MEMTPRLVLVLIGGLAGWLPSASAAEFQAGAAVRVITPDPLLPVSGGVGIPKSAAEKRGELTARAVAFQSGDTIVGIISLDLLGFPSVLGDRVRAEAPGYRPITSSSRPRTPTAHPIAMPFRTAKGATRAT